MTRRKTKVGKGFSELFRHLAAALTPAFGGKPPMNVSDHTLVAALYVLTTLTFCNFLPKSAHGTVRASVS